MNEVTFYRIIMVFLMIFSLYVAYTNEGIMSNNKIEGNTIFMNVSLNIPNQTECKCPSYNYPYFNYYMKSNNTIYVVKK